MRTAAPFVSPSEIERETGFGKDQLRKWRQRFAFPLLNLTVDGKAAYSRQTVDQLFLIKRLLEAGFRPGHVVGMTTLELEKLALELVLSVPVVCRDDLLRSSSSNSSARTWQDFYCYWLSGEPREH